MSAANKVTAVPAAREERPSFDEARPVGTQGIMLRANADELDVSMLSGTDVTDVILTPGNSGTSSVNSELLQII